MMKKLLLSLLMVALMPFALNAQTANDDLYYVPSKKKEAKIDIKTPATETTVMVETEKPIKVVVRDKKKQVRDIDEYNRRYDSREYEFTEENDTLYIDEREIAELDGEWVGGFEGSEDDYEYAVRLIRFRNPRYAISINSPFYWDIVYGMNSWDWNVYTDGYYAYAFPTYTNNLWWSWRYGPSWYNSYWGWGWYDYHWGHPYYAWHYNYYPHWHHHHHFYPSYVGGRHYTHNAYTNRASRVYRASASTSTRPNSSRLATDQSRSTSRRAVSTTGSRQTVRANGEGDSRQVRRGTSTTSSTRRVVGTRNNSTNTREQGTSVRSERSGNTNRSTVTRSGSNRSDAASSRRNTYTRPSSTRTTEATSGSSSTRRNNSSTYTRSNEHSSTNRSSTSTRSYDSGSSSSSRSSSSFSSGSSSRSSSGGGFSSGGGGGSRSGGGGGGSSRSSRR